jgi:hypothetical protein
VRSLVLSDVPPEEAILEQRPLVDELGQWVSASWPEKAGSLADLEQRWRREEADLETGDFGYGRYGGYLATQVDATGFFRTEERDGRWWLVDPEGHLFFSTGANLMWPFQATPTEGREQIFAELPPTETLDAFSGEPLEGPSFVFWNTVRRHGEEWRAGWIDLTVRRMQAWGLNTVGNWSAAELTDCGRIPYTLPLFGWSTATMVMGLPDVYSDEFVQQCDKAAREQCAPRRDDPYLVGYFVHNEPPWAGREPLVVDLILEGPETELQRRAVAFLAEGDSPERRRELIYAAFERFLEVVLAAIRRYDPGHLTLGMRFSGDTPDEMLRAARAFDVVSLNRYDTTVPLEILQRFSDLTGKPLMVGEFHFGVPGRGMASALRTVESQADRALAYRFYVETAASFPAFVGAHWFQWTDEPSTGRSDGECYSVGLVDVTDQPYDELVEGLKDTHRRLYAVHAGELEPYGPAPRSGPRDGR